MSKPSPKLAYISARNALGHDTVRLSNAELHREVSVAVRKGNQIVFESLPKLIAQVIDHKVWFDYGHKDFASYALDATSNGLGVNTNQRLWILRCGMDVHGEHIKEWADVTELVEGMVRLQAKTDGLKVRDFHGNSLELLAKKSPLAGINERITYLPSQSGGGGLDSDLFRLRRRDAGLYKSVLTRKVGLQEALEGARMQRRVPSTAERAQSLVRNMTAKERREFIDWMKEEGYLE